MARTLIAFVAFVPCMVLLLPAFVFAALALAFTSCVRAIGRVLEPAFVPWTELVAFDERLGWKLRAYLDTYYLAEHDDVFRIVTDGEGWPGRRSLDESKVVVIGDSFASGHGVDTSRSFAEVEPSLQIKALGAPGYSMVHGVLLMERLAQRLSGKLVVWFAYLENDLQDNLAPEMRRYRAPFARLGGVRGGWEIVDKHLEPTKWSCSNLDRRRLFPKLCVPGPLADHAYSACDYLIDRARTSCGRVGAHLVVVTIPHPMQLTVSGRSGLATLSGRPESCDADFADRRIAECCQKHGVPMVVGKKYLSRADYKRREGIHWNERGHRRMAKLLGRLYESFRSGALSEYIPREIGEPGEHRFARPSRVGGPTPSPAIDGPGVGR